MKKGPAREKETQDEEKESVHAASMRQVEREADRRQGMEREVDQAWRQGHTSHEVPAAMIAACSGKLSTALWRMACVVGALKYESLLRCLAGVGIGVRLWLWLWRLWL